MSGPGRFAGRRALVTGAASGIGLAVAAQLVAEGAAVVALDREPAPPAGWGGGYVTADVTDHEAVRACNHAPKAFAFGPIWTAAAPSASQP